MRCPQCQTENPEQARFCFNCGTALAGPSPSPPPPPAVPPPPSDSLEAALRRLLPRGYAERLQATLGRLGSERRMVTILFSDVKGSTSMAGTMDPEEWMDVMNGAFEFLIAPIYKYEGTLARLMGDAILAFFGAPLSHENDAELACRAALEIIAGVQEYAAHLERERGLPGFNVRVGINTGLVVVGEVGSDMRVEYTAMGDAVNLAARMEQNAPPGGILITDDTYQHVRGLFEMEAQPPLLVKGKDEPIQSYLVRRARLRDFRTITRGLEGISTRMVGRERELGRLQEAWHAAMAGRTHMVTVVGDAGVGKTRLLLELEDWLTRQPDALQYLRGRATPMSVQVPYSLWRDIFRDRLAIAENEPLEAVRAKFEAGLAPYLEAGQAQLVGHLVGFDFSSAPAVQRLSGSSSFAPLAIAYLGNYLRGFTADHAAVILLEDLHWADSASLGLLSGLLDELLDRRLLIVGLARPAIFERAALPTGLFDRPGTVPGQEGRGDERTGGRGQILSLRPLSPAESQSLVDEILQKARDIPPDLRQMIVEKAEGNPFYVEELIRMFMDDGVIVPGEECWSVRMERIREKRVPPTLHGVLQARLDSLPPAERSLLQRAAVVGRNFWDRLVADFGGVPGEDIHGELAAAQARELVLPRAYSAFAGAQEYAFRHAILRDVTYESVLLKLRRVYHRQVAEWLENHSGERLEEFGGLIAEHYERAAEKDKALYWLHRAADNAYALSAFREALAYMERALPLAGEEKRASLLLLTGSCHDKLGNYEAAQENFQAAFELAGRTGDLPAAAGALIGLAWLACVQGRREEERAYARQSLELARQSGQPGVLARALMHWAPFQESAAESLRVLEESLAIFRAEKMAPQEAVCLLNMGNLVFGQRDLEAAARYYEQSLEIFVGLGDRWGVANCLGNLGMVAYWRGDWSTAMGHGEEYLRTSQEIGDREGICLSLSNMGYVATRMGDLAAAERFFREAIGHAFALEAPPRLADILLGLADIRMQQGQLTRAAEWLGLVISHPMAQDNPEQQMYIEPVSEALREVLPSAEFEAALARGRALDLETVMREIITGSGSEGEKA